MHLLLIGILIGFTCYPVGKVLLKKLTNKAEKL